ncbi:membrane protease YdiL (CAAX protease family) [Hamadaea flava]|uniref:CPBP family intramembrane glutamic endopeptidase n=1 Tax=Hamadaea flava TaxID=1742688 RepID=A0ABV8LKJ4_9ACTN|nr:type II CAAX endopeptidase family protein [Hamadaea flava]MCP2323962.1 membrane protease YdiL (CAAX protease family) [Hamadaea flava]
MRTVVDASDVALASRSRNWLVRVFAEAGGRPRRGWRVAAYLIVLIGTTGVLSSLMRGSLVMNVAGHAGVVAFALAATYAFRRLVDRRAWHQIGVSTWRWRHAVLGLAVGTGSMLVVFAVAGSLGWARVAGSELSDRGPGAMAVLLSAGLFMYATSAFVQELAFRGYVLQTLADGWPMRRAALVSSLIFAILHFAEPPTSVWFVVVLLADIMLMAGFLVLTRLSTGALWLAIGFHTTWNWVMDCVLSMDTDAGTDYGNALIHVQLDAPEFGLGHGGGVELLYLLNSAALFAGYWLLQRRRGMRTWEGR